MMLDRLMGSSHLSKYCSDLGDFYARMLQMTDVQCGSWTVVVMVQFRNVRTWSGTNADSF